MTRMIRSVAIALSLAAVTGACAESALPTATPDEALMQRTPAARPADATIVGTALAVNAETGEFSTLIAALAAADLVGALDGKGQYTVFAPTNAAFAKLGLNEGNIGTLPTEALTDILLYHVTHGRRVSQSVVNARQITMLNGDKAAVTRGAGGVYIDGARIIGVDVSASNGIIHIIDTVMLPD